MQLQQQQCRSDSITENDERQQPNPMQAFMGSIGKAMLLKERKQQIAAQQVRLFSSVSATEAAVDIVMNSARV